MRMKSYECNKSNMLWRIKSEAVENRFSEKNDESEVSEKKHLFRLSQSDWNGFSPSPQDCSPTSKAR